MHPTSFNLTMPCGAKQTLNSLPSTLPSTTTSIKNTAFRNETISSSTVPQLSQSGASFVPRRFTLYGVIRISLAEPRRALFRECFARPTHFGGYVLHLRQAVFDRQYSGLVMDVECRFERQSRQNGSVDIGEVATRVVGQDMATAF